MSLVKEITVKNKETKERCFKEVHEFTSGDVSFMSEELRNKINRLERVGLCMRRFKGDIVTEGLSYSGFSVGDVLAIGRATFRICQVGKPCHSSECIAYDENHACIMNEGVLFAEILTPGSVKLGDAIRF